MSTRANWRRLVTSMRELVRPSLRDETALVFRQLAVLLESGVNISTAIALLAKDVSHPMLSTALLMTEAAIYRGQYFSKALAQHAEVFSPMLLRLVVVGEATGKLPLVLQRIADHLEQQRRLFLEIRSSLAYPLFVCALCLVLVVVVPVFLLDGVFQMLTDLHAEIPLVTRIIMLASQATRSPLCWLGAVLVCCGAVHVCLKVLDDYHRRKAFDAWLLRMRGLGPIFHNLALAQFARSLALMYENGLPILKALREAARTTGHLAVEAAADAVARRVEAGVPLHRAFADHDLFPSWMVRLVAAGDDYGETVPMLERCACMAEEEAEQRIRIAMAALEPAVLLAMGLAVSVIVLATMTPLLRAMERLAL